MGNKFNSSRPDPRAAGLRLSFRQREGEWWLEWRARGIGRPPLVATRRAHDTEAQLIDRIVALEERLVDPFKPKPVEKLGLRPFKYVPPPPKEK